MLTPFLHRRAAFVTLMIVLVFVAIKAANALSGPELEAFQRMAAKPTWDALGAAGAPMAPGTVGSGAVSRALDDVPAGTSGPGADEIAADDAAFVRDEGDACAANVSGPLTDNVISKIVIPSIRSSRGQLSFRAVNQPNDERYNVRSCRGDEIFAPDGLRDVIQVERWPLPASWAPSGGIHDVDEGMLVRIATEKYHDLCQLTGFFARIDRSGDRVRAVATAAWEGSCEQPDVTFFQIAGKPAFGVTSSAPGDKSPIERETNVWLEREGRLEVVGSLRASVLEWRESEDGSFNTDEVKMEARLEPDAAGIAAVEEWTHSRQDWARVIASDHKTRRVIYKLKNNRLSSPVQKDPFD